MKKKELKAAVAEAEKYIEDLEREAYKLARQNELLRERIAELEESEPS